MLERKAKTRRKPRDKDVIFHNLAIISKKNTREKNSVRNLRTSNSVSKRYILGVDHLIFDGGVVQIPKKISSICFWLKKKYLAEFLRRQKISSNLNQGVAKDFAWCVTASKVAVSHMIQDWASHIWYFASATRDLLIRFPIKVNPQI